VTRPFHREEERKGSGGGSHKERSRNKIGLTKERRKDDVKIDAGHDRQIGEKKRFLRDGLISSLEKRRGGGRGAIRTSLSRGEWREAE